MSEVKLSLISGGHPAVAIEKAREVVAIANEAADDAFRQCIQIIEREMMDPNTCRHRGRQLSKERVRFNGLLNGVRSKIEALMHEPIPF